MENLSAKNIFSETGLLKEAASFAGRIYEYRHQQQQMAEEVELALAKCNHAAIEAPTGTGKSFAYLIPAIIHAISCGKPVLISTETISLQEQIIKKDIPAVIKALGIEVNAVLAKGRGNYICMRRMNSVTSGTQDYLPTDELIPEIDKIYYWSKTAKTGCKSELDFKVSPEAWSACNSEEGNCLNHACPYFKPCFFQNARRQLKDANIIVANHALLFSDLAMKAESPDADVGILPEYSALIIDEAHTMEQSAAMNLGLRIHPGAIFKVLHRIYNPFRKRGLMQRADTKFHRFYENFYRRCKNWFEYIDDFVEDKKLPWRYREAGVIKDPLAQGFLELITHLKEFSMNIEEKERLVEFFAIIGRVEKIRLGIDFFVNCTDDNFVYWIEPNSDLNGSLSLNAAPIEVAPLLDKLLWNKLYPIPIIMTSATLAVNNSLKYFKKRLGLKDCQELILSTPFDYRNQVTKYLCREMPDPNNSEEFLQAAIEKLQTLLTLSNGRAFVLFTSYKMMNETANLMRSWLEMKQWKLLKQGDGFSNSRLVEEFKKDTDSVLFGTDSFWTGIDVPGEALSNVIIVKLPFAVPDHPLIEAKLEKISNHGGNSFLEYSVPEAVLKLRQGAGRLIRTQTDQGIIAILDSRIVTKAYGKLFINSLPDSPTKYL